MTPDRTVPIFDGHNDALLRMGEEGFSFLSANTYGGLDLPRARAGGYSGGLFAVYVPAPGEHLPSDPIEALKRITQSLENTPALEALPSLDYALHVALAHCACLFRLERESDGAITVVRTAGELEDALQTGILAAVLHIEGAEPIDPGLDALEVFYQAGLRSLGLVHSRPNAFAHGVPLRFGQSPDTGPGLTAAGRELVRACNRLGIMIDLSHLNERGFWEVADLSDAPLVATHSCVHAIAPSTRNLTDDQIRAIGESGGMIGLNFHVGFLRPDGAVEPDTPVELAARHITYLAEMAGIDAVGLGSDYDYIVAPRSIATADRLPLLVEALQAAGFRGEDLEKILYRNWVRVLRATWGR